MSATVDVLKDAQAAMIEAQLKVSTAIAALEVPPAPAPTPVPTPTTSLVLPGVCVNSTEGQIDWTRAEEAGCVLGRVERVWGSMAKGASYALGAGMRVVWICQESTLAGTLKEYEALSVTQQKAIAAIDFRNEPWPGGIGTQLTGSVYAEQFINAAAEKRSAGLSIPLLMQVRLAPQLGTRWMNSLATVDLQKLMQALVGNGLASHPYKGRMTAAQKNPASMTDYHDVDGEEWGGQRWLKEQQYIKNITGLTVPMWINEVGTASAPNVSSSVGSAAAVGSRIQALWQHCADVAQGKVLLPDGSKAVLAAAIYYDLYAWHLDGAESFGIYVNNAQMQQVKRTEGGIFEKFVAGTTALRALA